MVKLCPLAFLMLISACAFTPKPIRQAPKPNLLLIEAQQNFAQHQGKMARWGGLILEINNKQSETQLHMIAFPLRFNGLPNPSYKPLGRFIVKTREFLEPAVYTKDRILTVIGKLSALTEERVDEKTLTLPVLELESHYLWPKQTRYNDDYNRLPYNDCYPTPYFRSRYYYRRGFFY